MENNFEALNNMIGEINKLFEITERENKKIEDRIQEKKEIRYLMMCTDLAPYFELYRENDLGDMSITLCDYDYEGYNWDTKEKEIAIVFHAKICYLCFQEKGTSCWSMNSISCGGDFKAYDPGYMNIVDYTSKVWPEYREHFEKEFFKVVHLLLAEKAKRLNDKRVKLERELEKA